jgi:hypothetical protein
MFANIGLNCTAYSGCDRSDLLLAWGADWFRCLRSRFPGSGSHKMFRTYSLRFSKSLSNVDSHGLVVCVEFEV